MDDAKFTKSMDRTISRADSPTIGKIMCEAILIIVGFGMLVGWIWVFAEGVTVQPGQSDE